MGRNIKGEQTQKKIEQCFVHLMTLKEWDSITVRELCTACDISRGTFYLYYDDIYDLMDRIQRRVLQDLESRYREKRFTKRMDRLQINNSGLYKTASKDLDWVFSMLFQFCRDNQPVMLAMTDVKRGDSLFQKRFGDAVKSILDDMMDKDGMPHDAVRNLYQNVMVMIIISVLSFWLKDAQNISERTVTGILESLRSGGIQRLRKAPFDELQTQFSVIHSVSN